ncbi:MAG: hypothetical protein LUQ37_09365 [Methanoregulaceae archaeon]|nr:hypothetical protein [Methanoregulaceae archaeon]
MFRFVLQTIVDVRCLVGTRESVWRLQRHLPHLLGMINPPAPPDGGLFIAPDGRQEHLSW